MTVKVKPTHIIIVLLVIAVGVLAAVLVLNNPAQEAQGGVNVEGGRSTVMVEENAEQILAQRSTPPPDGHYIATMTNEWTFDTWNSPSQDAYVENETRNLFTVYFDVNLDSDGSLVYSSPYLPVGGNLSDITLTSEVPVGDNPATLTYFLVDEEENVVSQLSVAITLKVLG